MPLIQIQKLQTFPDGSEVVLEYLDIDVANHREYLAALESVQLHLKEDETTLTLGGGSPKAIRSYSSEEDDYEQIDFLRG